MPGRKHGKSGQVLLDSTSPYNPVAVADLNAWSLDMKTAREEVTAFGDTNVVRVQGLPDFSGTLGGWWNAASSPALFSVILGGLEAMLKLIPSTDDPTYFFTGLAYIDGSISVSATGAIGFSGSWVAAANWTMAP